MAGRKWVLRRNCSISPRQLAWVYAALSGVSLIIALTFAVNGAWYILGFSILEVSAVGVAFYLYARHASDRDCIAIVDNCVVVELVRMERVKQFRLDPYWTRVRIPVARNELVGLDAKGIKVEVGRYLTEWKRREFARELQRELALAGREF